jgi:PilZ domain
MFFSLARELPILTSIPNPPVMPTPRQQNRRQYPRIRVSWPVVVNVGKNRHLSRSLDVGMYGAKVRTKARLATGTTVQLELVPSEGSPLRVEAVVWRVDSDGLAFLFRRGIQHPLLRAT